MHDQRLAANVPNRLQQLGGSDLGTVAQCARARGEPRWNDYGGSRVRWSLRHFASMAARLSGVPDAYAAAGESPPQVGQTTSAPDLYRWSSRISRTAEIWHASRPHRGLRSSSGSGRSVPPA